MNGYEADFKSRRTRTTELRQAHEGNRRHVQMLEKDLAKAIIAMDESGKDFRQYTDKTAELAGDLPA